MPPAPLGEVGFLSEGVSVDRPGNFGMWVVVGELLAGIRILLGPGRAESSVLEAEKDDLAVVGGLTALDSESEDIGKGRIEEPTLLDGDAIDVPGGEVQF